MLPTPPAVIIEPPLWSWLCVCELLWVLLYKLGLSAQVPFFDLYRLSFCCLPFACILLAFCLLAFSFVAILHCCAFPFSDSFFLSVLLPALLSDLSFTGIFLAVLPCDDLDYTHDFPTVSAPNAIDISMR